MSLTSSSLKRLLERSQNGDKKAYSEFFTKILPIVETMVRMKVFYPPDREDVTQTILMGIHTSLPTFDINRPPKAWIKAIAHHKIIDYIRKFSKIRDAEEKTEDGDVTIFGAPANSTLELEELLNGLPETLRAPIILTKIKGHDTKEAAEILNIKENAVRTRISRGLKQLKKLLLKEHYESYD